MNKILAATAFAVISVIGMAPPTAAAAPAGLRAYDRLFVKTMRAQIPEMRYVAARDIVKGAKTTCNALDAGAEPLDLVFAAIDAGFTEDQAFTYVAGSVVWYCDEYGDYYDNGI